MLQIFHHVITPHTHAHAHKRSRKRSLPPTGTRFIFQKPQTDVCISDFQKCGLGETALPKRIPAPPPRGWGRESCCHPCLRWGDHVAVQAAQRTTQGPRLAEQVQGHCLGGGGRAAQALGGGGWAPGSGLEVWVAGSWVDGQSAHCCDGADVQLGVAFLDRTWQPGTK